MRRTNEILKKTFSIQLCSRDEEIRQISNIIKAEQEESYIFRTDIRSFFEKLPFSIIVEQLFGDNLITNITYNHLGNIDKETSAKGTKGLPRGLCISSSLSEYALSNFDYKMFGLESSIYYARYVDDIVLLTSYEIDNIEKKVEDLLPFELRLNEKKTSYEPIGKGGTIEYLGYSFDLSDISKIKMSERKTNRIKKRIVLSLRCYIYGDEDFLLLIDRLRFLSGNTLLIMANRAKPITVGIRYQYQFCSDIEITKQLNEIDTFFKKILFSKKYYLSKQLSRKIKKKKKKELLKISFKSGFENKITHSLSRQRIAKVKRAWKYE